ncbi:hypothetical protein ABPG75_002631 [Micractinium tetrahymenae]
MTQPNPFPLLLLPDSAILSVLRFCDARTLLMLELTGCDYFSRPAGRRLSLCEEVAREAVLARLGGSMEAAQRFRHRSWLERLHLEEATGAGFDRAFSSTGGFRFHFSPDGSALRSVQLAGMGPKLLVSDVSTAHQPVLRWQLRVCGNTAVEFGVIPAGLPPSHTALHKCQAAFGCPQHRAQGFCSQITAGSLLPLKAPVMRGTLLDIVARRGHLEVILRYPPDAKEVSWQNGQPVQRPYRGPAQLRLEQDFAEGYDVRLAVTSWARAHFEVLHGGYSLDPEWAAAAAAEQAEAEATAAAVQQQALAAAQQQQQLAEELMLPADAEGVAAEALLPALAGTDAFFPLLAEEQAGLEEDELAAFEPAHPLDAAEPAAAQQHAAELPLPPGQLMQLAGGLGLQAEPVALVAAAVVAAGPLPAHLAVLQQLHAQQQQVEPAAGPAATAPAGIAAAEAVALLAAGAGMPAEQEQEEEEGAADATALAAAVAAAAAPPAAHAGLPPLCPSPSVEFSLDGQLPSPE